MGKKKKSSKKEAAPPAPSIVDKRELTGLLLLFLALSSLLGLLSFQRHGEGSHNWLGIVGNILGWSLNALFGLSALILLAYLAWLGWRMLLKKAVNRLPFKNLCIAVAIVSLSILLSLLEDQVPQLSSLIYGQFYAKQKLRYHLGGAPFFFFYRDLPGYSLLHIFNAFGIAFIFSTTFLFALFWLAKINPISFLRRMADLIAFPQCDKQELTTEQAAPAKAKLLGEAPPVQESDFLRYVKLRIPQQAEQASDQSGPVPQDMLAIQPENHPKQRPSLSRKAQHEGGFDEASFKEQTAKPSSLQSEEGALPALTEKGNKGKALSDSPPQEGDKDPAAKESSAKLKRDKALNAQRIHNGDFSDFQLPSPSLLTQAKKFDQSSLKKDLRRKAEVLEETLQSFGIEAKVGQINCGPTITSFEVHPAIGVKVQKIKTLENDIALNMEAKSIRIIAPIPGKAAVGIEVPNAQPEEVGFKEMLSAYQQGNRKFAIPVLLGKAVNGEYVMSDLTKMPHCIIAGATGSGKSVCINTIVMSMLLTAKPDELKLIMVDPKKVELTPYSKLPHMLAPVITEPHGASAALNWLVKEMEKRYEILKQIGARNIEAFNSRSINKELEAALDIEIPLRLPYIVGIIDELADLMMVSSSDIETPIARIAQMARAVGIHLILATQRPSREVITGLIKANFPTRIAFKVSSRVNSQIILDDVGAESLLGNGDMLFLPPGSSHLVRAQGAYIRDEDINAVVKAISAQAPARYVIASFDTMGHLELTDDPDEEPADNLYAQALDIVLSTGNASTTFLQRKLKIGYARAASLIDLLEKKGIVGPAEGSKPRKILASRSGDKGEVDFDEKS